MSGLFSQHWSKCRWTSDWGSGLTESYAWEVNQAFTFNRFITAMMHAGYSGYIPEDVNKYGDVKEVAPGWVEAPLMKTRKAPFKFTLVKGWSKGRWPGPKKVAIVPESWWNEMQK